MPPWVWVLLRIGGAVLGLGLLFLAIVAVAFIGADVESDSWCLCPARFNRVSFFIGLAAASVAATAGLVSLSVSVRPGRLTQVMWVGAGLGTAAIVASAVFAFT